MATSPNPKAQSVLSLLGMVIIMEQLALLVAMISVLLLALWFVGTVWIDWWELVVGYWWLSMPIACGSSIPAGRGGDRRNRRR
jgi:hypothetical protein